MSRLPCLLFAFIFLCLSSLAVSDIRSPLAHWPLDGNGDNSVGDGDLSIEGGDFDDGKYGQALSLDGSGAHAIDGDGADYLNGLDAITIAMWVKSNQVSTDKGFLICVEPNGQDKFLSFRYDLSGSNGGGTNLIKAGVNTDGGKSTLESSNNIQTEEWQHVAMIWESGADIKLYVNGAEDVPTNVEPMVNGVLDGMTAVIIGKGAKDTGGGWDGLIDDVYIYGEALNADEIALVMEGTALSIEPYGRLANLWGGVKNIR